MIMSIVYRCSKQVGHQYQYVIASRLWINAMYDNINEFVRREICIHIQFHLYNIFLVSISGFSKHCAHNFLQ